MHEQCLSAVKDMRNRCLSEAEGMPKRLQRHAYSVVVHTDGTSFLKCFWNITSLLQKCSNDDDYDYDEDDGDDGDDDHYDDMPCYLILPLFQIYFSS